MRKNSAKHVDNTCPDALAIANGYLSREPHVRQLFSNEKPNENR